MSDAESRLAALLADDGLPERDAVFRLAVAARVRRRGLVRDLIGLTVTALLGMLVLWALAPGLTPWIRELAGAFGPAVAMGSAAASLALMALLVMPARRA